MGHGKEKSTKNLKKGKRMFATILILGMNIFIYILIKMHEITKYLSVKLMRSII